MATQPVTDQIIRQLDQLTPEQQKQVLAFTTNLLRPRGEPGSEIIRHAHKLDFPLEDLVEIQHAIEQDCENASHN
jgi:hypothetical protein